MAGKPKRFPHPVRQKTHTTRAEITETRIHRMGIRYRVLVCCRFDYWDQSLLKKSRTIKRKPDYFEVLVSEGREDEAVIEHAKRIREQYNNRGGKEDGEKDGHD